MRVSVNDELQPLEFCREMPDVGMCSLEAFVKVRSMRDMIGRGISRSVSSDIHVRVDPLGLACSIQARLLCFVVYDIRCESCLSLGLVVLDYLFYLRRHAIR